MATKMIALDTDMTTAFAKIRESLAQNKAEITAQQPPQFLSYTLQHSSLWTGFFKVKLEGTVKLEAAPDGKTVAHLEIRPAQNALLNNAGINGALGMVAGMLFLGPLSLLIVPLTTAGVYMHLNNSLSDDTLNKLGTTIPSDGSVVPAELAAMSPQAGFQPLSQAAPPPSPSPLNEAQAAVMAQLRALGDLRDQGILTPQEFEAKKTDLLARI